MHCLLSCSLLQSHSYVQWMATKQANILKVPVHSAGLPLRLFISLRTARVWVDSGLSVNVPQMKAFVLQAGFVRVNQTEVGAAAHSSLLINAAPLFHLASVSDTYVHAAPITHSFHILLPSCPLSIICCLLSLKIEAKPPARWPSVPAGGKHLCLLCFSFLLPPKVFLCLLLIPLRIIIQMIFVVPQSCPRVCVLSYHLFTLSSIFFFLWPFYFIIHFTDATVRKSSLSCSTYVTKAVSTARNSVYTDGKEILLVTTILL